MAAQRPLDPLVSVVAPVLDERECIEAFVARTLDALADHRWELIVVDDGSTDGTAERLDDLAASDPRIRVVHLSRNFGHQAALTAGLERATGDAVVTIDSDLQDPPELIGELVERWRDGSDVVYAVREARPGETRFKLATARWFYRLFQRVTDLPLAANSGDFRLLDRRALEALLAMTERSRFLRGMTVWIGFTQTAVPYRRDPRPAGATKYSLRRMVRFSLDAFSSFTHAPLQLATALGFLISAIAFVAILVVVALRIAGSYQSGFATLTVVVLLLGGIQLISIGLIGEYLGRVYDEVKRRPLYVVRDESGADAQPASGARYVAEERVGQ
jgi:dolichol-phosphate mannosyltransferase